MKSITSLLLYLAAISAPALAEEPTCSELFSVAERSGALQVPVNPLNVKNSDSRWTTSWGLGASVVISTREPIPELKLTVRTYGPPGFVTAMASTAEATLAGSSLALPDEPPDAEVLYETFVETGQHVYLVRQIQHSAPTEVSRCTTTTKCDSVIRLKIDQQSKKIYEVFPVVAHPATCILSIK